MQQFNLSPIPVYHTETSLFTTERPKWECNRWFSYGNIYPLQDKEFPSFFFKTAPGFVYDEVEIYKLCNKSGTEVSLSDFEPVPLPPYLEESYGTWTDVFITYGVLPDTDNNIIAHQGLPFQESGFFFVAFKSATDVYYTEVFQIPETMTNYVQLEWSNNKDVVCNGRNIPYEMGFINRIYIDATIGRPTYEMEEEGEERMGFFYPTKQVSYKKFNFVFYAPEFLCDILRLVPLADNIAVFYFEGDGSEFFEPTKFDVDFSWLENGNYAKVECEFTTDTVVKNIGRDVKFNK